MDDLQDLAAAGASPTGTRFFTNPLRRLFWFLGRPYFQRIARAIQDTQALAQAIQPGQHRAERPGGNEVPLFVPPGHFYSPVVDPRELNCQFLAADAAAELPGINCDIEQMKSVFGRLTRHYAKISFPERPQPSHRFYYQNEFYSFGDALILAQMILEFRPRRIIEVGSGFSSAVILDTLDQTESPGATQCTFIDPDDGRLRQILRPGDSNRVTVLRQPVQNAPLTLFEELGDGDFLFLDTTHVAKTGSDVVFELFEVLPRLMPGVFIHIHDIFDGFEYPRSWIFDENRSWNELYFLRAFLMYNDAFRIVFFNDKFARECPDLVAARCPLMVRSPGGALWLRKQ